MSNVNPANERIKREYFRYLGEALGRDGATLDCVAQAIARFEDSTRRRDFKRFHREQAVAFKKHLALSQNARTSEPISKATVLSTLRILRAFFFWLAHQSGYKKHIAYSDADYFNLSDKDVAIARATRQKRVPSLEQVHHVLSRMPAETVVERRDRALIAFTALTAARVGALASLQLQHIDLDGGFVDQDARAVRTKFAKTFRTYFMDVGGDALRIVTEWVQELRTVHLWAPHNPIFPSTEMAVNDRGEFVPAGLQRRGWTTTAPVREVFRRAFEAADLPYYNPHSFRDMIVHHAMGLGLTIEQMKAWSQNLGHQDVLTTLTSYGSIPPHRQGELIRQARSTAGKTDILSDPKVLALIKAIQDGARQ